MFERKASDTLGETTDKPTQDDVDDFEEVIQYLTSVANACQRLDITGFMLERSKREYECYIRR